MSPNLHGLGGVVEVEADLLDTCQNRRVCLETYRHAGGTMGEDRALLECLTDRQTDQAETPMIHASQRGY